MRSPKKVAPEYLLKIRSFLAVANEKRSYWESERLVTLVTDFEADTDDVEQAGYMYNRLFWAGATGKSNCFLTRKQVLVTKHWISLPSSESVLKKPPSS